MSLAAQSYSVSLLDSLTLPAHGSSEFLLSAASSPQSLLSAAHALPQIFWVLYL